MGLRSRHGTDTVAIYASLRGVSPMTRPGETPFRYVFRVRYGECDAQQVVFNARYGDYADQAATEFLRAIGMDYRDLLERGLDNQVVKMTMEWQSPARFDEILCAEVEAVHVGNTSYRLFVRFVENETRRAVATVEAVYVMVTTDPWEKTPIPDDIRGKLEEGARGLQLDQSGTLGEQA